MAAAVLLALAPLPVTVGRILLADRGATPLTASAVAIAAAATVGCLVGSVTAVRLAYRPDRDDRSTHQSARHSARGPARRIAVLPRQAGAAPDERMDRPESTLRCTHTHPCEAC